MGDFRIRPSVIFTFLASLLLGTPPAFALTITLAPTSNHPGGNAGVAGSGFGANEAVDIYFDTTDELLVVTDGNGKFIKHAFNVPGDALPGQHWISAIERDNGKGLQKSFTVTTAWAEFGFNPSGKRYNSWENVLSPANVSNLDTAWTAKTGNSIDSTPAVAKGIVYIGSEDHSLYAFDALTGKPLWSQPTGDVIAGSSPAVANGIVYVGSWDHKLYAFDAVTGAPKWTGLAAGPIESSPTVSGGEVYVGSDDQQVWSFDAVTGAKGLSWGTGGSVASSPAVADGAIYVGSADSNVYAFDLNSTATIWTRNVGASIVASPAIANGQLYIETNNTLNDLADNNGFTMWTATVGGGFAFSSAAIAGGIVYLGGYDGNLHAYNATTGALVWTAPAGAGQREITSSAAVANGVVYIGSNDRHVYAFDARNGAALWSANIGLEPLLSSPAVSDGMVYIGDSDGKLRAYALNGGNNAAYKHRHTTPPSFGSLHPNPHLKRQG